LGEHEHEEGSGEHEDRKPTDLHALLQSPGRASRCSNPPLATTSVKSANAPSSTGLPDVETARETTARVVACARPAFVAVGFGLVFGEVG
jgi:hypothetical protein